MELMESLFSVSPNMLLIVYDSFNMAKVLNKALLKKNTFVSSWNLWNHSFHVSDNDLLLPPNKNK